MLKAFVRQMDGRFLLYDLTVINQNMCYAEFCDNLQNTLKKNIEVFMKLSLAVPVCNIFISILFLDVNLNSINYYPVAKVLYF